MSRSRDIICTGRKGEKGEGREKEREREKKASRCDGIPFFRRQRIKRGKKDKHLQNGAEHQLRDKQVVVNKKIHLQSAILAQYNDSD